MSRVAKAVAGLGALLGCAVLWLAPAAGAATLRDNFASRETVKAAPLTATGSNVGAGREAGEPVPTAISPAGHTVWLGWEAPSSAYFTFSTCASSISTVVAFYVGSEVSNLSEEQSQASFIGSECSGIRDGITSLFLTGGKVQIMVDGNNFYVEPPPPVTEGPLTLQIEKTPPPSNDNFVSAAPLAGQITEEPNGARSYFAAASGYNYNATKETGEPKHDGDQGGASVWYTWTAPESGIAHFGLCCGTVNLIGVYTGNAVNALTPVGSGKGSAEVPVTAGTTYRVAVDSEFNFFLGGTLDEKFNLTLGMQLAPGPGFGGGAGSPADKTPPQTTLLRGKKPKKATTKTFAYKSSEPNSTFRCRLDRQPFARCGSSKTYRNLKPGKHKFEAFAVDAAGNRDATPVVVRFTVPRKQKHHRR